MGGLLTCLARNPVMISQDFFIAEWHKEQVRHDTVRFEGRVEVRKEKAERYLVDPVRLVGSSLQHVLPTVLFNSVLRNPNWQASTAASFYSVTSIR